MNILFTSFLYFILLLFPVLTNNLLTEYKIISNSKKSIILIKICFYISYCLLMKYNDLSMNIFIILLFFPLIYSLSLRYINTFILLSIVLMIYSINIFPIYLIVFIITFIIISYIFYLRVSISKDDYLTINMVSISTIIVIYNIFYIKYTSIGGVVLNILYIIIIFIIYFSILYILRLSLDILRNHLTCKDIDNQKQIKLSVFKIAHEIKNPLAVIKGYIELYNINHKDEYINIIDNEVNRTLTMLNEFSSLKNIEINKKYINLNDLLKDVKLIMKPLLNTYKCKCYLKINKNINIYADYDKLKQVFINLIKNSIESTSNNGLIHVKTISTRSKVIIKISDNGKGMDKKTLDNIFVPFYTTKKDGTGIGTCISKEIIQKHNGNITYFSKIDKGTLVYVKLPLYKN